MLLNMSRTDEEEITNEEAKEIMEEVMTDAQIEQAHSDYVQDKLNATLLSIDKETQDKLDKASEEFNGSTANEI